MLTSQTSGNKLTESYTYYLNGNQKSKTSNGQTTNYVYDKMNRLVSENDTVYTFDDFGNRKTMTEGEATTTYTYDLNNRLLESNEVAGDAEVNTKYFYDANGNQTTKAVMASAVYNGESAGHTVTGDTNEYLAIYEYNCYNQLVGVDTNGVVSSYAYLPDGMRLSKTVGDNTTTFVYDGANIIEEITEDGVNKYYRGIEIIKNDDNVYYLYNGQGDVAILTDSTGNTVASYIFDAYGNTDSENNVYNNFGYRGEYADVESGLIYLRARYYDPSTGRFINEDPIRDGLNWYVYCGGNPVMFVDPWGLYNREKAVEYAKKWYNDTNSPTYERFDTAEMSTLERNVVKLINKIPGVSIYGGDCANFVSQCLVAGGLEMNSFWHYYLNKETVPTHGGGIATITERDMTAPWSAARNQYNFFSSDWAGYKDGEVLQIWSKEGLEYNAKNSNIQKGDLLYFAYRNNRIVYHATIITKVSDDEIYYNAHTSARDEEPLSNKLESNMVFIVRIRDDAEKGYVE